MWNKLVEHYVYFALKPTRTSCSSSSSEIMPDSSSRSCMSKENCWNVSATATQAMIQVIRKPGAQFKRRKGAVKVLLLARVLVHMTTTPRSSRGLKGQARTYVPGCGNTGITILIHACAVVTRSKTKKLHQHGCYQASRKGRKAVLLCFFLPARDPT